MLLVAAASRKLADREMNVYQRLGSNGVLGCHSLGAI
jgi:hypothetical protein